jgi:hypothetical protein
MDTLIAAARRPYHQWPPPPPESSYTRWRLFVSRNAFSGAKEWWTKRDAYWRITITRLAVRAYQKQHGALPPSLAALVPAYLPSVPQDPFAPQPLVYRRQGSRPLIYSRGPDGDDDGGRDLGTWITSDSDGDLVTMRSRQQPAATGATK